MIRIAFDIDGTLLDDNGKPHYGIITLIRELSFLQNVKVFIWSGGGLDYAKTIVEKFGLREYAEPAAKCSMLVDVAFDDKDVDLGKVNIQV